MNLKKKFIATLIGLIFVLAPLLFDLIINDLSFYFYSLTIFSYFITASIAALFIELVPININNSLTVINVVINFILLIIVSYIYYRKIKRDMLYSSFYIRYLIVFYIIQFFIIHRLFYDLYSLTISENIDANDFIGVVYTCIYSSMFYLLYGIIIDFYKYYLDIRFVKF